VETKRIGFASSVLQRKADGKYGFSIHTTNGRGEIDEESELILQPQFIFDSEEEAKMAGSATLDYAMKQMKEENIGKQVGRVKRDPDGKVVSKVELID